MALDYEQSAVLMKDQQFIDRVKVSCLKFADYIKNEPANTPAHSTRTRWADDTMRNPNQAAATITPPTVMDTNVQADGAAITDANLQTSVEATVNKLL
jgi:hypothetical protein